MRTAATIADVMDRVLDKGILIEYGGGVSRCGIDALVSVDACCLVVSVDTYLEYGKPLQKTGSPRKADAA